MDLGDERLGHLVVDGQELFVPSTTGWEALLDAPYLDGRPLPWAEGFRKKVQANAAYRELTSAVGFASDRVHFYELLSVDSEFYRVFVESVVCDFCGHRAVASATPGVDDIYWGAEDEAAARERSFSLPRQSCHACKRLLDRRRTVWQVN